MQSLEKMHKFVSTPNLPSAAKMMVIGEKYVPLLQKPLKRFDIEIVPVPANPRVDHRLASHADLSVFHGESDILFLAGHLKNTYFPYFLADTGFSLRFCGENQSDAYPHDAMLNICSIGKYYIYNPKVSDPGIISYLAGQGGRGIACKQGYCKCSVCVVNENAIITADKGISSVCRNAGIDVLEIQPGFVELDGFDYGFIGGAAFKISSDILAFTGHLDHHPDKDIIIKFLEKHNISPVFLTDTAVFDIGSAVPLIEKELKM